MTTATQLSKNLVRYLFNLSADRKIFNPLNYSILHDFFHAKTFSLSKRVLPDVLEQKPKINLCPPQSNPNFRGIGFDLNVLVLAQQLNDNYIFPVLQFLDSEDFKRNYSQANIQFEFLSLDTKTFKDKHQQLIESFIASKIKASNITFKYIDIKNISNKWIPSNTYFENIFEIPSQIVPIINLSLEDAGVLSDVIATNLVVYESALKYLADNEVSFVITANDQWYPTSAVFAAACDLSIPTIMAYHGTMPEFAEYTFADQIYYYSPSFYAKNLVSKRPRYVDFELPLDLFIAESRKIDPVSLLQKSSGGARSGTLGIVCALNGDMIYGISDYKKSLDDIINAAYDLKSASNMSLHSVILRAHPHQNAYSKKAVNDSLEKLRQVGLKCTLDNSNSFLEFVSRCGPLAACPSTALDSLLYLNYPFLVSSTSELMDIVFGKQLYDDCDFPVFSHKDQILTTLKKWFPS
jgi:hypothetical protein